MGNGVVVQEDDVAGLRASHSCADAAGEAVILSERKQTRLRESPDDGADTSVGRAVVDQRHGRPLHFAELRRHRLQARQSVFAAVPIDDDDVDGDQDGPPMRRFNRSRTDAGFSGSCRRTANAALSASRRGFRQKSRKGFKASGH